jgi:hypothetical protein
LAEATAEPSRDHGDFAHRCFSRDDQIALAWLSAAYSVSEVGLVSEASVRQVEPAIPDIVTPKDGRPEVGPARRGVRAIDDLLAQVD